MAKEIIVHRDQAVWERETWTLEVPDHLTGDELREYVQNIIEVGPEGIPQAADFVEVVDTVVMYDPIVQIFDTSTKEML